MQPARIVVLISGNGSNLQALIEATRPGGALETLAAIALVVSSRADAYGLVRAEAAHIPTLVFAWEPFRAQGRTRQDYDAALALAVQRELARTQAPRVGSAQAQPDLIVLAGFMRILTTAFLDSFADKPIINLHPALPGQFDGTRAIERALEAYQRQEIEQTGVMVHYVTPEVDRGEPILVENVPMARHDTLQTLQDKIHGVEHRLLPRAAAKVLRERGWG